MQSAFRDRMRVDERHAFEIGPPHLQLKRETEVGERHLLLLRGSLRMPRGLGRDLQPRDVGDIARDGDRDFGCFGSFGEVIRKIPTTEHVGICRLHGAVRRAPGVDVGRRLARHQLNRRRAIGREPPSRDRRRRRLLLRPRGGRAPFRPSRGLADPGRGELGLLEHLGQPRAPLRGLRGALRGGRLGGARSRSPRARCPERRERGSHSLS